MRMTQKAVPSPRRLIAFARLFVREALSSDGVKRVRNMNDRVSIRRVLESGRECGLRRGFRREEATCAIGCVSAPLPCVVGCALVLLRKLVAARARASRVLRHLLTL